MSRASTAASQDKEIMEVSQGLPFYMVMALTTERQPEGGGWHSREDLLDERITRLREQVKDSLKAECFTLLALATLVRGLPWKEVDDSAKECQSKKKLYDELLSADTAEVISPLQPDLEGEYLILSVFDELVEEERNRFLATAWRVNPVGVAATLYRMYGDFPHHPLLPKLDKRPDALPLNERELIAALEWWMQVRVSNMARSEELGYTKDDIGKNFALLKEISESFNEVGEIQLTLARGAFNAVTDYGNLGMAEELSQAFAVLQEVAKNHPDHQEIQLGLAKGAFIAGMFYVNTDMCRECRALLPTLVRYKSLLTEQFPLAEHIETIEKFAHECQP
jgi:hypothetical protein